MTLVPAVMHLLGERAWWLPRWLDRILPSLDIEGESLADQLSLSGWPDAEHAEFAHVEGLATSERSVLFSLHLEPGEIGVVAGDRTVRSAALLALTGRRATDAGRARVAGGRPPAGRHGPPSDRVRLRVRPQPAGPRDRPGTEQASAPGRRGRRRHRRRRSRASVALTGLVRPRPGRGRLRRGAGAPANQTCPTRSGPTRRYLITPPLPASDPGRRAGRSPVVTTSAACTSNAPPPPAGSPGSPWWPGAGAAHRHPRIPGHDVAPGRPPRGRCRERSSTWTRPSPWTGSTVPLGRQLSAAIVGQSGGRTPSTGCSATAATPRPY